MIAQKRERAAREEEEETNKKERKMKERCSLSSRLRSSIDRSTMSAAWLDSVLSQRGSRAPPYRPESRQAVKRHLVDLTQVR